MGSSAKKWQLQEAKNKFSEVVRRAAEEGPQTVTRHGKDSVVILSADDYRKLEKPEKSLTEFFRSSPLSGVELDIKRDRTPARDVGF